MHRPGIDTGSIAWQAPILTLNQRCLIYNILIVWTKLLFNLIFSSNLWTKSWKFCYSLIEVLNSAEYFGSFLFFDSGTVKKCNKFKFALFRQMFCFAVCICRKSNPGLSRGRRQFYHWTIDTWFNCYNRSSKVLLNHPSFSSNRWFKILKTLFHFNWGVEFS